MMRQQAIESRLIGQLVDHMCAEVSLGTVTSIDDAVKWLQYTYLYVRMRKNPLVSVSMIIACGYSCGCFEHTD
jgi:replicative superfamily II helicase